MSRQVIVGTIGRPHGLRGEVTVRPRTDEVDLRFAPGAELIAEGRTVTVTGHMWVQGRLVVSLAGVTSRSAAEAWRGTQLWAAASDEQLGPDEFHDTALIGLIAVDADGERLGEVVEVQHPPAQDLLVIRTAAGDRLVPFVSELVPEVDLAAGRVVLAPIRGLLEEVEDAD